MTNQPIPTADLQTLKELIYEKLPRLKELSFGCEVEYCGEKEIFIEDDPVFEHRLFSKGKTKTKRKILTKLLGHPIRLNHVFEAWKQTDNFKEMPVADVLMDLVIYLWEGDTLDEACAANPDLVPFLLSILQ